ncbi:MAG: hypothetical protein HFK00_04365 [Oscillospiraceae bacterium]|nr:hypothetical protein [Oscillospiraceae bacterium]
MKKSLRNILSVLMSAALLSNFTLPVTASIDNSVKNQIEFISEVTLPETAKIKTGETSIIQLGVTRVKPMVSTDPDNFEVVSEDETVLKIKELNNGTISATGISNGKTNIVLSIYNLSTMEKIEEYVCNVEVSDSFSDEKELSEKEIRMVAGKKHELYINELYNGLPFMGDVKWSSADKSVAIVNDSGIITAKSLGETSVKAVIDDVEYQCSVFVECLLGDVDNNGEIDVFDAVKIARYSVGTTDLAGLSLDAADYDDNGVVDVFDAVSVARITVGK